MVLEDILLALAVGAVGLIMLGPVVRFLTTASWRRRDPVAEARERLRAAKQEAEAARLNREAEAIYAHLYDDVEPRPTEGASPSGEDPALERARERQEKGK